MKSTPFLSQTFEKNCIFYQDSLTNFETFTKSFGEISVFFSAIFQWNVPFITDHSMKFAFPYSLIEIDFFMRSFVEIRSSLLWKIDKICNSFAWLIAKVFDNFSQLINKIHNIFLQLIDEMFNIFLLFSFSKCAIFCAIVWQNFQFLSQLLAQLMILFSDNWRYNYCFWDLWQNTQYFSTIVWLNFFCDQFTNWFREILQKK